MKFSFRILLFIFLYIGQSKNLLCQTTIKMQKIKGVFSVPCTLNGVKLNFVFDTGASDVTISQTEANFLFKNGYLTQNDILGKKYYSTANGEMSVGTVINIKKLEFSGIELNNVEASVIGSSNAPLLLGQSAMKKIGKFQFDPNNGIFTLLNNTVKSIDFGTKEGREFCESGSKKQDSENYEGAMEDYNRAIEINPNYFEAYWLRGTLKALLENHSDAIVDFSIAIRLNPNFEASYLNRGWSKEVLNDYKGALVDYSSAIKIEPSIDGSDYFCRAGVKKHLGDQKGAILDYNKVIETNPSFDVAYFNRGHSRMILKDYKGAISDFDLGIAINPNDGKAYYNMGQAKMYLNKKNEACSDWRKALELGYENAIEDIKTYCN